MDIRSFLDTLPHGGIKQFAAECEISESYLLQLAAKQDGRVPSAKLCKVFWQKSGGQLTFEDMRPDDWRDFPFSGAANPLPGGRRSTDNVLDANGA